MNRRRSVLIAESDRACAQWMKLHLERAGFRVYVAFDGEQAAIHAARQRFELIIASHDLPVIGEVEFLRHVREDLQLTETPIAICISGPADAELIEITDGDSFARIFQKPIDATALLEFAQESVEYQVSLA